MTASPPIALLLLAFAFAGCGDDGNPTDGGPGSFDGAPSEGGPGEDGSADAPPACADIECGPCERCVSGRCVPVPDGAFCGAGACRAGACCEGCWDGTACQVGTELDACGGKGSLCASCSCAGDACVEGQCAPAMAVTDVSAGGAHTCAVRQDGTLWCWGRSLDGQVGVGDLGSAFSEPQRVGTATDWAAVAAGGAHTCAVRADGTLWCWGDNLEGQLGLGTLGEGTDGGEPARVEGSWRSVVTGDGHTCAIDTDGALHCWGANRWGELGIGTMDPTPVPSRVGTEAWTVVAAGADHTCALRHDGTPWCWGRNTDYQLGLGTAGIGDGRPTPFQVATETTWVGITAGAEHTMARQPARLWGWGRNRVGELGTGDTSARRLPWPVSSSSYLEVNAGTSHTCAVNTRNVLLCWGRGANGRLGIGTTADRDSPSSIDIAPYWAAVSAGDAHTCALQTTGALFCWGSGGDGRLGSESPADRALPVRTCVD